MGRMSTGFLGQEELPPGRSEAGLGTSPPWAFGNPVTCFPLLFSCWGIFWVVPPHTGMAKPNWGKEAAEAVLSVPLDLDNRWAGGGAALHADVGIQGFTRLLGITFQ